MTAVGVCGFPRSGTTMMMTMLHFGGVLPVAGSSAGGYELDGMKRGAPEADWWWERYSPADVDGHAVKLLDNVALGDELPTSIGWRFVWMDRDPREQARSQAKFLRALAPDIVAMMGEPDERAMQRSLRADRARCLAHLRGIGETLVVQFEAVLAEPYRAAVMLREFLTPAFDADAAASVVLARGPRCRPDMAVEAALAETADR